MVSKTRAVPPPSTIVLPAPAPLIAGLRVMSMSPRVST
jgi:hypothetical protein